MAAVEFQVDCRLCMGRLRDPAAGRQADRRGRVRRSRPDKAPDRSGVAAAGINKIQDVSVARNQPSRPFRTGAAAPSTGKD